MVIERTKVNVVEFERFIGQPENQDALFELIDGEIVQKVVTQKHGIIAINISTEIKLYLRQHKIGRVSSEASHRPAADHENERQPDISVVCDLAKPVQDEGAVLNMPDLAVEIKSPSDTYKLMRDKAKFYLANGTRMVWLVFPEKMLVEVYTPTEEQILTETDTLTGGEVLPGFTMNVSAIFEM